MNRTETLQAIKALPDITASWNSDTQEYRVTYSTIAIRAANLAAGVSTNFAFVQRRAEDVACYTNDGQDALDTARSMQDRGYRAA